MERLEEVLRIFRTQEERRKVRIVADSVEVKSRGSQVRKGLADLKDLLWLQRKLVKQRAIIRHHFLCGRFGPPFAHQKCNVWVGGSSRSRCWGQRGHWRIYWRLLG